MRGRRLAYSGQAHIRPMKERVREAVFNLVGPAVVGSHAVDLFAGTGALGLEALSRGARRATFVERHFPTADLVRQNAAALGVADRVQIEPADAIIWVAGNHLAADTPWVVFCSPPYVLYNQREADLLAMLGSLVERAPPASTLVVEADERFDMSCLPRAEEWDVRRYPPAVVAIFRTAPGGPSGS